jgi:ribulose 1,5-bisphosphate synthetase/thiazole synthase
MGDLSQSTDQTLEAVSQPMANGYDVERPLFELQESPVENFRPVKVIVIGAGFSGIYCGVRIPQRLKNVDLTIYEKNAGVGGTWWENRFVVCGVCRLRFTHTPLDTQDVLAISQVSVLL